MSSGKTRRSRKVPNFADERENRDRREVGSVPCGNLGRVRRTDTNLTRSRLDLAPIEANKRTRYRCPVLHFADTISAHSRRTPRRKLVK
jgi:hypothetical protein